MHEISHVFFFATVMHVMHRHAWDTLAFMIFHSYELFTFLKAPPCQPLVVNMPFWERGSIVLSLIHCGAPKACAFSQV